MIYIISLIIIILGSWYLWYQDSSLSIRKHTVKTEKNIKENIQIVHISDFHNTHIKKLRSDIIQHLRETKPDYIMITGDLIDSRRTDIDSAIAFVNEITEIAPVYYVTGNHEMRSRRHHEIMERFASTKMHILRNESVKIHGINLIGLDDLYLVPRNQRAAVFREEYQKLKDKDSFNMVMLHRPELFKAYCDNGADLVLSGHAHGGQFIIPGIGGILSPDQGLFPKYTQGLHQQGHTVMIVSRGIGNSLFPFRVNNRPEIIDITITDDKNAVTE